MRYRLHDRRLPGTPDIVFPASRVAVFVDGDFWRGRVFLEQGATALRKTLRGASRRFWIAKITKNVQRDRRQGTAVTALGWRVIRVWERTSCASRRPSLRAFAAWSAARHQVISEPPWKVARRHRHDQ